MNSNDNKHLYKTEKGNILNEQQWRAYNEAKRIMEKYPKAMKILGEYEEGIKEDEKKQMYTSQSDSYNKEDTSL